MRRDIVTDESGMATVEGAFVIATIVAVLIASVGAVSATIAQIRCTDAAREVARLTAAGDPSAVSVGRQVAGAAAAVDVSESAELIEATVSTAVRLLPGLRVSARAVAVPEPDGLGQVRFASGVSP
ncbi:TadE family type IV pilus minor pilin [Gordonia sp. (in: high G+C Gram-positive bacteria)]|jgi:Flp pilus assembly pilin Flp|uniref:TadE family type IV pilus minor pilin n=1 Tax=Gordonia sp. (in: high G+C Gram-positive bacteria) TaxID=84139 RepID=UPI001D6F5EB6|nr:TadE family type IV pilus minor pilin [Gordonia sp. (in: high G+C Gram-positive bacteria)]MCB1295715.1 pilus assembly protein TadE [Gordonia sp. (in: high G+C Gram-positive bacteria)]HMS76945.1 TadE family type IV pilus minor pilin [Gordonia sp. (in: high G+C Gram-positive bacteria)]